MPIHLYLSLGILSSWLVFGSILCWMVYGYDMSFNFIVAKGSKRIHYALYILICLFLSYYVFCIRVNRVGKTLDIFKLFTQLKDFLSQTALKDIFIVVFVILLLIIFWILLLRCIYQHLKKCILALYLYQHQFKYFRKFCVNVLCLHMLYDLYLVRRVKIFTKSARIHAIARTIWPIGTNILERNLFYFFIPYLTIFDILTQDGHISKIFIILPWFYLYTVLRSLYNLYFFLDTEENEELSESVYGLRLDK